MKILATWYLNFKKNISDNALQLILKISIAGGRSNSEQYFLETCLSFFWNQLVTDPKLFTAECPGHGDLGYASKVASWSGLF